MNNKKEIDRESAQALECVALMWNQYCTGPSGHMWMTAGESSERLLKHHDLMRDDQTAIEIDDDDYPYEVMK